MAGLFSFPVFLVVLAGPSPARQGKGVVASPRSGLATTPFPWRATSLLVARGVDTKCNAGKLNSPVLHAIHAAWKEKARYEKFHSHLCVMIITQL